MTQTAARVLLDTLVAHGIDRAFCVPGESYLSVMDELHADPVLDLVTCRHEGGAAWMALADARMTARAGVVFASRGPGPATRPSPPTRPSRAPTPWSSCSARSAGRSRASTRCRR